ncbi:MAG TPA: SDR family NAD(P)-dependent oxidoreductase [Actinomycetota bacterium]|nr:SDR family NAD(P)-dependent oxidoreductase [Actinomycetota bacterium]
MGRLEGKVAVITGAGRGIGRATAVRFAQEGAAIVVNDIDPDPAEETAQLVKEAGGQAAVSTDNTVNLDEARQMMERAAGQFGKIDILVNNAGITRDRTFHNMDDDTWNFVLDINLKTAFHTSLAAMPYLREPAKKEKQEQGQPAYHRKITFTTSTAFLTGNAGQANYTAAKGAVVGLTRTLARELGAFHINVNAVAPGFIETRLTKAKQEGEDLGIPEQIRQMALMMIGLGYYGQPEDVATAHLFLASPEADYISGAVVPVAGALLGT